MANSSIDFDLAELERCRELRDVAAARSIADRLATAAADQPRIIERVSLILEDLGALDVAEDLIGAATRRYPADLWIAVRHASIAALRGDVDTATSRWSRVIHAWPNDPIGTIGLAAIRLSQGDHDAATHLYRATATRFPDNVWAADGVASVATAKRDWVEAAKLWADVHARFPDHTRAREQLGIAERNLRHETAKSWAESAQEQGNLIEAVLRWQTLVDQYPDWVEAHLRIAFLNRVLGRPRCAVDALRTAILRFPAHVQVRLDFLDAARADGDVDLALDTLAWLSEHASDGHTQKQAYGVLRQLLDVVADFAVFRRAALLALAEPEDHRPGAIGDFIVETASTWPDRRAWIERVCEEAASLPETARSHLTRLASCRSMLARPLAGTIEPAVAAGHGLTDYRVIPLMRPSNDPAAGALEPLRRRTTALLAYLNAFVADRRLRRYQADILRTGTIGFGDLFGAHGPVFSGCLYYAPPKAFAYRFVIDGMGYWLITDLATQGYPIVAVYDEASTALLYDGADPTADLKGFLGRQVRDIQAVASGGAARAVPEPRVVLVSGFANYAHHMWNELPALLDIERWPSTKIDEIAVVYEPFGPFEQTVRWPDAPPIRRTSDAELGGDGQFREALLFTPGSSVVTAETRLRLREVCATFANGNLPEDRGAFTVWVSLRRMYRHATNMLPLLASVIRRIESAGLAVDIMLDGFSPPFDVAVKHRYDTDYYIRHQQIVEAQARAFIAEVAPACRHVRLLDTTWASLPTAITIAARADFYICHHGTQQHKIGWMYDIPGLIHGNVPISAQNPRGGWAQAQCDSPVQPDYIPAQFIGDAVTDNERQDMPAFRDYEFIEVEKCADFVFARVSAAHDLWSARQKKI